MSKLNLDARSNQLSLRPSAKRCIKLNKEIRLNRAELDNAATQRAIDAAWGLHPWKKEDADAKEYAEQCRRMGD